MICLFLTYGLQAAGLREELSRMEQEACKMQVDCDLLYVERDQLKAIIC